MTSFAGLGAGTVAGSIAQSGTSVSGAVHVFGSNCFDHLITIGLTGTMTDSNLTFTSTALDEQVITITGSITEIGFSGSYTISGGCANGEHGNVTGIKIPSITGSLYGTFTPLGGKGSDVAADLTQRSPGPEGSFGFTGNVNFRAFCAESGTITPGAFPSHSFIIGTFVSLEIQTDNGTLLFLGTMGETVNSGAGRISGQFTLSGGTCDHTGTGFLDYSVWGY